MNRNNTTLMPNNNNNSKSFSNSKPLIAREQHYVLDRKLVTVHSEDRDITKWPNSNTFEIMLPEPLLNVQSMRLIQATMPGKFFTFSNDYQNTKLNFTINNQQYPITIQEGYYTPCQLSIELSNLMSRASGSDASFNVFYDTVGQKFWIGHTDMSFNLNFGTQNSYSYTCDQPTVWNNYANWGLPYYLGFEKKCYTSSYHEFGISFDYIAPNNSSRNCPSIIKYFIEAPFAFQLTGDNCMYMEIDKYNSYDEIYPYNQSSRQNLDNNAYSGKTNSAFAKIPITSEYGNSFDSRTFYLQNVVQYDPPIERIARLKFKFRFHDGRLVNFQNYPFDFTIEFNSLRNEIEKKYSIRIPASYIL